MLRVPFIALTLVATLLVLPSHASAGITNWTAEAEKCGGAVVNGAQVGSERGSGQLDAAGRLYLPCSQNEAGGHDNYILVLSAAGQRINKIPLEFVPGSRTTHRASDVAPSPDGSFLYVVRYDEYTVYRFDRQADGTYRARSQAEWKLGAFPWAGGGGANLPRGQFLATDGGGSIYLSTGLWTCQPGSLHCTDDAVVKYHATGAYVTRFGRKTGTWNLGESAGSFGGVAVTADGRRVFVTDINNSRVQRFDRQGDGSYTPYTAMGMTAQTDPNRWGACYGDGRLAAPYDVAMSPRGELLVINTSCYNAGNYPYPVASIEVQRFGQDGSLRGSIMSRSMGDHRIHGIAVDRTGSIHLVQGREVLRPAAGYSDAGADVGGGGPLGGDAVADTTPPTITALTANPTTTTGTAVTLSIAAADALGVTELRIREDGVQGGWRGYATAVPHTITERLGAHDLQVEVRDAAGNISAARGVVITRTAPPVVQPPVVQPAPKPVPVPISPVKPAAPAGGGDAVVIGGGGAGADAGVAAARPDITTVRMPVQVFRGRAINVAVAAKGVAVVTHVRFSTNGRWSAWQRMGTKHRALLPAGTGWKGVFVQVQDSAGTRSVPWFQPVLVGKRGIGWAKGTRKADRMKLGAGAQHVDLSSFDQQVDRISCGGGFDTVYAQPNDIVGTDCERVLRVRMPAW